MTSFNLVAHQGTNHKITLVTKNSINFVKGVGKILCFFFEYESTLQGLRFLIFQYTFQYETEGVSQEASRHVDARMSYLSFYRGNHFELKFLVYSIVSGDLVYFTKIETTSVSDFTKT